MQRAGGANISLKWSACRLTHCLHVFLHTTASTLLLYVPCSRWRSGAEHVGSTVDRKSHAHTQRSYWASRRIAHFCKGAEAVAASGLCALKWPKVDFHES